jgi:putative membrane protein
MIFLVNPDRVRLKAKENNPGRMTMRIRRLAATTLAIYAVLTAYIVIEYYIGNRYRQIFTPLMTFVACAFALLHGSGRIGWRRTLLLLGLTFSVSLLFESIGVATGLVYGDYSYTDKLGPKFLGLVPYLIPVAWFMMTYPSYVIAERLVPAYNHVWKWRLAVAAVGAVVMTAWDLAMDPIMVSGSHWVWKEQGAYFGVPLQNYWGWWLTMFVALILFLSLGRMVPDRGGVRDDNYDRHAILSYALSGFSAVMFDLQSSLGGPGLVGFFAMLPWVMMGWR